MNGVSLFDSRRHARRWLSVASLCLLMMGCSGQKYGFSTFSWKGDKQPEPTRSANTEPEAGKKPDAGFSHIALNDATVLDPAALADLEGIASTRTPAGAKSPGNMAAMQLGPANEMDDLDAAFATATSSISSKLATGADQSLAEFTSVVASVEQGDSPLAALKSSLQELNDSYPDNRLRELSEVSLANLESSAGSTNELENVGLNLADASSATAESESALMTSPAEEGDFPWVGGAATAVADSPGAETAVDRARNLLNRSLSLIQQNNLLAARTVAESAQSLLTRTQAVLLPGEVTPEQVLAEIKQRQLDYERQALLAKAQSTPASPAPRSTPVVIDLSRDWVNPPAHTPQTGRRDDRNDIEQFAQALVKANQPAVLPLITPRGMGPINSAPNSDPQHVSESESDLMQAPPALVQSNRPARRVDSSVVRLGDLPTSPAADSFVLSSDRNLSMESVGNLSDSDIPAPPILLSGPNTHSNAAAAPILFAPGGMTNPASASDFDEFAADFAGVSAEATPEMGIAPLLIDESELQQIEQRRSFFSPLTLTMMVGGLVVAVLLLLRTRR